MDENQITQRLRDAGDQPVPGEVRATHLSQMHATGPVVEKQKRFGRLAVAAAAFVGFAVGSTGFAMAGALPDPAQGVAHDVLSVVQVQVPDRPDNRGQCISDAARTLDGEAEKQAKQDCKADITPGRPDGVGQGKGRPEGVGRPEGLPSDRDPCKGRPPFAGKMDPAEKQAKKEQWAAECGRGLDDDPAEAEAEVLEDQREREAEAAEEQREEEQEQQRREVEALEEEGEPGAPGNVPEQTPPPAAGVPGPQDGQTTPEETPAPTGEEPVEGES